MKFSDFCKIPVSTDGRRGRDGADIIMITLTGLGLIAYFLFKDLSQQHPILGKVLLVSW